jgi:Uma2 family endonuclease
MTLSTAPPKITPLLMDVSNTVLHVTPQQFGHLCIQNPDLRLELTKDGELIVMTPAGGETSEKNGALSAQVYDWNQRTQRGRVFDSSGGYDFTEIGGGMPSPDVSWIEKSRLLGISIVRFIPVVPDFVIELRSASDNLKPLQQKMLEYQRLGVRLGLLIDPKNRQVEIYRPGQPIEQLEYPRLIDCDDVLPGFTLNLVRAGIWPEQQDSTSAAEISWTVEQLAKNEERREIVLRQLDRKLHGLPGSYRERVVALTPEQLLELGDALLDFSDLPDLENWLLDP